MGKKTQDTPLDPLLASRIEEILSKASLDDASKDRARIGFAALAPIADQADVMNSLKDLLSGEIDVPPTTEEPLAKSVTKDTEKSEEINMEKSDISEKVSEIADEGLRTAVEAMLKKSAEDEKAKEEALAKAAKLEDEKKTEEFMKKASEFSHLPSEGLGELLKSIADKAPEEYEKLEEMLRATETNMAKSAVYKEIGKEQYKSSKVEETVNARAAEIMAKSEGKVNKVAAKALAWTPDSYQEWLDEEKRGS
jgi:hypothetical protein